TARAYHNLAVIIWTHRGVAAAYELELKAAEVAEQLGNAAIRRFNDAVIIEMEYELGRWDEALRGADAFIAECERGAPHYNEATQRGLRARILLARDDLAGAEADAVRGLELARAIGEPQSLMPSRTVAALVLDAAGRA